MKFQTIGMQHKFRPNQKWISCNMPIINKMHFFFLGLVSWFSFCISHIVKPKRESPHTPFQKKKKKTSLSTTNNRKMAACALFICYFIDNSIVGGGMSSLETQGGGNLSPSQF